LTLSKEGMNMTTFNRRSLKNGAKIAFTVTFFVLSTACSHENIPADSTTAMIPPLELENSTADSFHDQEVEEPQSHLASTVQETIAPTPVKRHKKATKKLSRRTRAKQAKVAIQKRQHKEKVAALAQGSLSNEIALPPPSIETPSVLNGPELLVPSPWDSVRSAWPYALIPLLAAGWIVFTLYSRRIRARNRRLVYHV